MLAARERADRAAARAARRRSTRRSHQADPANTECALLYALARGFGLPGAPATEPDRGLTLLRSAGVRGEAEAIAAEVSRLLHARRRPGRDRGRPPRPRPPRPRDRRRRWRRTGSPTALEAELPVAGTAVGGALVALLEAEFGSRRAADLLRYLRGPSGFSPRPGRLARAAAAAAAGSRRREALAALAGRATASRPRDLLRLREAAARSPAELAARSAALAATMASRPLRDRRRRPAARRPATASSCAPPGRSPRRSPSSPSWARWRRGRRSWRRPSPALGFRAWCGPVEGRVRIASPYRLRAGRFDHVVVGSLQDGEFPRRDRGADPFLSETQRESLGLDPRRDREAEERYLFQACLALPRRRLHLSYRDSDENGAAEARSPLLDDVRALLAPAPDGAEPDPVEAAITRRRDLAGWSTPLAEAPSEDELARALAAHGPSADAAALLAAVGVGGELAAPARAPPRRRPPRRGRRPRPGPADQPGGARLAGRGRRLRRHHPGGVRPLLLPLVRQPRARPAAAGAAARPARPGRADARGPRPPLQGAARRRRPPPPGLARRLDRAAGASCSPRSSPSASSATTRPSGRCGAGSSGCSNASSPRRPSARPAASSPGCSRPRFGERRGQRAAGPRARRLGAARGDRPGRPRARRPRRRRSTTSSPARSPPREKFEERAKLQLPLYLLAVAEHWGGTPVGGLYHALRGTSTRRPRGVVAAESAGDLAGYDLYSRDVVHERGAGRAAGGRRGGGRRRSSPACAPARSAATPARARACAATTSAPPSASSRRSAAATARPPTRRTRSGGAVSEAAGARATPTPAPARQPTPEQAAAIGARGGDVLLEAGAGTGKTGVMVDRYCRLVCDERVSPDAILAFTFTDKAAAELRAADPRRARAPRRGAAERRAPRAARLLRRRLGDDDPRLLQPASSPPTRWRPGSTPASACSTRRRRRAPPARPSTTPSPSSSPAATRAARRPSPPSRSTACGRSSPAPTTSCAAAASPTRGCPSRRLATPRRRCARRSRRRRRPRRGRARTQMRAARRALGAARRSRARRRTSTSCARSAPTARRKPLGRLPRGGRGGGLPLRRGGRGRRGLPPRRRAARALLGPLRGGQGAARRDRLRGPADPRRAAARAGRDRRGLPQPLPPPAGRRVPGHQPPAAAPGRGAARAAHAAGRGRRRAAVDLRLPPRRPRRLPRPAATRSSAAPTPS